MFSHFGRALDCDEQLHRIYYPSIALCGNKNAWSSVMPNSHRWCIETVDFCCVGSVNWILDSSFGNWMHSDILFNSHRWRDSTRLTCHVSVHDVNWCRDPTKLSLNILSVFNFHIFHRRQSQLLRIQLILPTLTCWNSTVLSCCHLWCKLCIIQEIIHS